MKPTELLTAEHRVIEQGLDCLEALARRCGAEGRLDGAGAADALEFIRGFADRCHHGKEEAHLFRFMEERGFPRNGGPVGVMLTEHEQGRAHVRAMAAVLQGAAGGNVEDCATFRTHAGRFVALLRQHIEKEDHCLFPMADQALDAPGQDELRRLFENVDHDEIGDDIRGGLLEKVDALADRLEVESGRGRIHAGNTVKSVAD